VNNRAYASAVSLRHVVNFITVLLLGHALGATLITVLLLGRGMLVFGLELENLFRAYTSLASARDVLL
jgi:hypothetical protein